MLDKKDSLCYYNIMKQFKIYTDGKYDLKANFIFQAKIRGPEILQKLDDAFNRLYEI